MANVVPGDLLSIPSFRRRWRGKGFLHSMRGSVTIWFTDAAVAAWKAEPRTTRGGQSRYSALAIATALTLRAVFRLALRQTEGLIGSIIALLGLDLAVPDHTTLSRRAENLDVAIWIAAVRVMVHFAGDLPPDIIQDRKEAYLYVDISKDTMEPEFDLNVQRVQAQLAWLKDCLADGRLYLSGDAPSALGLGYYHPILPMRRRNPAEVDDLLGLAEILLWFERVAGLGHGTPSPLEAEAALAIAIAATPAPVSHIASDTDPPGLRPETIVSVTPDDTAKVPVTGMLVAVDALEIVIQRDDPDAGDLHLHFPRAGFDVRPA